MKNETPYYFASILILSLILNGCATESKSIGLGGAIGAGSGALIGGIADGGHFRTRNVIIGAALGGMAGMVTGALVHEHTEDEKKDAFLKGRASAPAPQPGVMPNVKPAKVETQWIEGHRVGNNRWVDGHFEYVISEPAQFESQ